MIADDQRVVRDGLAMLVGLMEGIDLVATASDGNEAIELVAREQTGRRSDGSAHARD